MKTPLGESPSPASMRGQTPAPNTLSMFKTVFTDIHATATNHKNLECLLNIWFEGFSYSLVLLIFSNILSHQKRLSPYPIAVCLTIPIFHFPNKKIPERVVIEKISGDDTPTHQDHSNNKGHQGISDNHRQMKSNIQDWHSVSHGAQQCHNMGQRQHPNQGLNQWRL